MRAILMFRQSHGGNVTMTVSTNHNCWRERGRAELESNRGPSAYQPSALYRLAKPGSQLVGVVYGPLKCFSFPVVLCVRERPRAVSPRWCLRPYCRHLFYYHSALLPRSSREKIEVPTELGCSARCSWESHSTGPRERSQIGLMIGKREGEKERKKKSLVF